MKINSVLRQKNKIKIKIGVIYSINTLYDNNNSCIYPHLKYLIQKQQ